MQKIFVRAVDFGKEARMRAIIPAAGWGRRMGSPPAKELLPHPIDPSRNFLELCLDLCAQFGLDPLIISRQNKEALNDWLSVHLTRDHYLLLPPTSEWSETVWLSHPAWGEENILLLPDVFFEPLSVLEVMKQNLKSYEMVLATHRIPLRVAHQWGLLLSDGFVVEKPQKLLPEWENMKHLTAWGVIAFRKSDAVVKFWEQYNRYSKQSIPLRLPIPWKQFALKSFIDLTRGSNSLPGSLMNVTK